ncbi:MmgE/PrpD family protein [Actinomarinicola tropica]|uniref:2-methylcitrate dehydratase n=1 Tax=Actinomarinicola tropica TaxID=2789776 RepID=A0A5Q2RAL7_9ACTN|nr:MmgE/PrpD family protein [Actinomarinicola tropica]QGG93858.1 2-methylcitrate dehydratase [Actinomarinicola tropica]
MGDGDGDLTSRLSAWIATSPAMHLDDEVRELARRHVLDTLASVVACRDLEPAVLARRYAVTQSGSVGTGGATILGTSERAAPVDAVVASAMTAHGAEINDFIPSAFVQPGPSVVSVALALAEARGLSGDAVLRAVAVGYELAGRIPKALGVGNLRRAGIANHGVGPVFGAGATAASLIGLSTEQVGHLLTYCAQQASGSWQWMLDVEHIEKSWVFAGMGARNGLQAALMVDVGFRGVRGVVDHPAAWFSSPLFTHPRGDGDLGRLVDGLGERWELPLTAYKRYPVGGPTQPAVEGILRLLPEIAAAGGVDAVQAVQIAMPGRWEAFRDAEMPALNLPYLTAIILLDGRLDFVAAQSLERMHGDAAVAGVARRVEVVHAPDQESGPGEERTESATVTVTLASADRLEVHVPHVRGFPSHPMDRAEVEEKALELMGPHLGTERSRAVIDAVRSLDDLADAGELVGLVAR